MRYLIIILSLIAFMSWGRSASAAGNPFSAGELLKKIQAQQDLIRNFHFKAAWERSKDGKLFMREEQEFSADEYGRMVVAFSNRFRYDHAGKPAPASPFSIKKLFDGKLLVEWSGRKQQENNNSQNLKFVVNIKEGLSSDTTIVKKMKNPCYYMLIELLPSLEKVVAKKGDVRIQEVLAGDGDKIYLLEFEDPSGRSSDRFKVQVNSSKGWTVEKLQRIDLQGEVKLDLKAEYTNLHDDIWFPTQGSLDFLQPNSQGTGDTWVKNELLFSVTEQVVNSDKFDESIFEIVLEPGTWVNDGRYETNYTIGGEKVYDKQLFKLASESRKTNTFASQPILERSQGASRYVVGVAFFLFFSLGIVFISRRSRKKQESLC